MAPYRINLFYYSGKIEHHYIMAQNYRDAFDKGHKFCDPEYPHDGVYCIDPHRLTKKFIAEHNITIEEA